MTAEMKTILLMAPIDHLSEGVKLIINAWDEKPTALQILHTIDIAVSTGGASELALIALGKLLNFMIEDEKTTFEDLVKQATWRDNVK